MNEYLILAAGMIILPGIYMCLTLLQTEKFTGISKIEVIVLAAAEFAFFRMWRNDIREEVPYLLSIMRYVMLAFMTYFCVEDYREQLVPNRVLLFLLVLFPIIVGGYGVHDMDTVLKLLPFHYSGIFIQPDLIWHGIPVEPWKHGGRRCKAFPDYGNISDGKRYSGRSVLRMSDCCGIFDHSTDKKKNNKKRPAPICPIFIYGRGCPISSVNLYGAGGRNGKEE